MPEKIIKTTPRKFLGASQAERWQFIQDKIGFRTVPWVDINKLTKEERVEFESAPDSAPWFMDTEQETFCKSMQPRFPTLALAEEWAALEDKEITLSEDMQAFWAPSECYAPSFAEIEKQRTGLLLKAII